MRNSLPIFRRLHWLLYITVDAKPRFAFISSLVHKERFYNVYENDQAELGGMKEMELHFGMICNKEAIYSGLIECQSSNRQFAICYNSKNKLLVKICTVAAIRSGKGGLITVILHARTADGAFEAITVPLNHIESIYPINEFVK